ncbi:MAG: hypothetical protein ACFCUX_02840 [Candidatus Methylacidiphilales bacterium]
MNPHLINRVRAGGFARITLEDESVVVGYLGTDPEHIHRLRLDSYLLNARGLLEQLSLSLEPDDICHIQFLSDAPEWLDGEGNSLQQSEGFFPET